MSQRELAEVVGVRLGGMHYVLNALIEKDLVNLGNFTAAEDKRRYAFILTPKGIAEKQPSSASFWLGRWKNMRRSKQRSTILRLKSRIGARCLLRTVALGD